MIKYSAKIDTKVSEENLITAISDNDASDLSGTINTIDGIAYVGAKKSDADGNFVREPLLTGEMQAVVSGEFTVIRPQGRVNVVNPHTGVEELCALILCTAQFDVSTYIHNARLLSITNVEAEVPNGAFYSYRTSLLTNSSSTRTIAIEILLYMPRSVMEENDLFDPYVMPISATIEYISYKFNYTTAQLTNSLTIVFDDINGIYPKTINIDGKDYNANGAILQISDLAPSTFHTLYIPNLNKPNSSLTIKGIKAEVSPLNYIDYRILRDLSAERSYRGDLEKPSFGIISGKGSLSVVDDNDKIFELIKSKRIQNGEPCIVQVENTITKNAYEFGHFVVSDITYDSYDKVVDIKLSDELQEWQDINIGGFYYNHNSPKEILKNKKARDLYEWLYDKTPQKYNMIPYNSLDSETKSRLNTTIIGYPMLSEDTLWNQWTKLCTLCGLYIYKKNNSQTICKCAFGR